jgi:hypothetical protein
MSTGDGRAAPPSVLRRFVGAVDAHPIPALILMVGVITVVFWNSLNYATGSLHAATGRIDALVKDVGGAAADIRQIREETRKIDEVRAGIRTIEGVVTSIHSQLAATRSFEVRVVESYGVAVDHDLFVDVIQGRVIAFPLSSAKTAELERARFQKTSYSISRPVHAVGWAPPVAGFGTYDWLNNPRRN